MKKIQIVLLVFPKKLNDFIFEVIAQIITRAKVETSVDNASFHIFYFSHISRTIDN